MSLLFRRTRRRFLPEPPDVNFTDVSSTLSGIIVARLNYRFVDQTWLEAFLDHALFIAPRAFCLLSVLFFCWRRLVYPYLPFFLVRRIKIQLIFATLGFALGCQVFYGRIDWVYLVSFNLVLYLAAWLADYLHELLQND